MSLNKIFIAEILLISLDKLQVGAFSLSSGHQLSSDLPLLLGVWGKKSQKENSKKKKIKKVEVTALDAAKMLQFFPSLFHFL